MSVFLVVCVRSSSDCLLLNVLTDMSVLCLQITHVLPCDAVYIHEDEFRSVIFCKDISNMF